MKRAVGITTALAAAVTLVGCSPAPTQPSARCEPVSTDRARLILGESSGVRAVKAAAVKSTEHGSAYYIAIRFAGPGIGDAGEVGVWASSGAIETGLVVSVDAMAEQFSALPKHDAFSTTDKGAAEARTCV